MDEEKEQCTACNDSDFKRLKRCIEEDTDMDEGVGLAPCSCGRLYCKNCIDDARTGGCSGCALMAVSFAW